MKRNKKKLSDYFTDQKFGTKQKQDCLLLVSKGEIAWVVGHRPDERFKITPFTQNILMVALQNKEEAWRPLPNTLTINLLHLQKQYSLYFGDKYNHLKRLHKYFTWFFTIISKETSLFAIAIQTGAYNPLFPCLFIRKFRQPTIKF